jgi:hypothetical protein
MTGALRGVSFLWKNSRFEDGVPSAHSPGFPVVPLRGSQWAWELRKPNNFSVMDRTDGEPSLTPKLSGTQTAGTHNFSPSPGRIFSRSRIFTWAKPNLGAKPAEHHRKRSFEDEFVALLKKSGVTYDPKFVFG